MTSFLRRHPRALPFLGVLILVLIAGLLAPIGAWSEALIGWVEGLGGWGPVLYAVAYVLAVVLLVPTWGLSLGAGALFGPVVGLVVAFGGMTVGATIAFLLARTVLGVSVRSRLDRHARLRAVDEEIGRRGWLAAVLLRLSPLVPYNVLNYVLGVTRLSLRGFLLAHVAMLPVLGLYVFIGATAGQAVLDEPRTRSPFEWTLLAVGLVATLSVTLWLGRVAARRLPAAREPEALAKAREPGASDEGVR